MRIINIVPLRTDSNDGTDGHTTRSGSRGARVDAVSRLSIRARRAGDGVTLAIHAVGVPAAVLVLGPAARGVLTAVDLVQGRAAVRGCGRISGWGSCMYA